MAGELWGMLLRRVVRDDVQETSHGERAGAVEADNARRSVVAVSGPAHSSAAEPGLGCGEGR